MTHHFWGCLESQLTIVALSRYDKFWAKGNEETPNMLLSILVSFYRAIKHSALKLEKLCNNKCVYMSKWGKIKSTFKKKI